jgi:hypothetical protein
MRILNSFIAYYFLNDLKNFALSQVPCLLHEYKSMLSLYHYAVLDNVAESISE